MSDLCRVFVVGNFNADIERRLRDDGTTYGVTTLCVGRTVLVGGQPVTTTTSIPVEAIGASRVASVAQQFGAGSRVLIEGHLEYRNYDEIQALPRADGSGNVLVRVPHGELVVVIDTLLNAAHPIAASEVGQHPAHIFWQEQS